ncbi:MAG: CD3073 family putative ECF transporter S component [Sarcina sp.]
MKNLKTKTLILCAMAIVLNIVLGTITSALKLPFYLDTIGTVFIALFFGPWLGASVGALSNIITGMLFNPSGIPFLLISVAVGLIVGFIGKKFKFTIPVAIITGLILSIVCPLIGTPIGIWVYGGLTGTGLDFLFMFLKESGQSVFTASFIPKVINNLLDKIGTCVIIYFVLKNMPSKLKNESTNASIV